MARKQVKAGITAVVLGLGIVSAGGGIASATGPSTFCTMAGLPSTSKGVVVPHVINATVNTCGNEKTPPNPPCSFAIDQAGLAHVRVYACNPIGGGPHAAPNASPTGGVMPQGNTTPPPDCGFVVDRMIGGWEIFACAATPAAP